MPLQLRHSSDPRYRCDVLMVFLYVESDTAKLELDRGYGAASVKVVAGRPPVGLISTNLRSLFRQG